MRDDVMMQLVDRAMSDEDFRRRAQEDPEETLRAEGFELEDDEIEAVKSFQSETMGMSDEELNRAIAEAPRRQGAGS